MRSNQVGTFFSHTHLVRVLHKSEIMILFALVQVQEAPRQRAKQRLRMILVADRCSVSPTSVSQIKKAIVESLSNFVEIEQVKIDSLLLGSESVGSFCTFERHCLASFM